LFPENYLKHCFTVKKKNKTLFDVSEKILRFLLNNFQTLEKKAVPPKKKQPEAPLFILISGRLQAPDRQAAATEYCSISEGGNLHHIDNNYFIWF